MKLRPYQKEAYDSTLEKFEIAQTVLCVMATGTGKTVVVSHVAKVLMKTGRILLLAHREELIFQGADKLEKICDSTPDLEMGENWARNHAAFFKTDIVVSSIQTQNAGRKQRRMERFDPNEFSLVIVDEAHHSTADSYRRAIDYYSQNPNLKVLGITATPNRTDEEALGEVYEEVAFEYGMRDGVDDGWLVLPRQHSVYVKGLDYSGIRTQLGDLNGKDLAKVMEFEANLHGIADPTVKLTGDKKTLVFAASIAQAERLTEIINRHKPESAQFVCGKTPKEIRRGLFKRYAEGKFQYLVNVGVATEGFDEPSIQVVVMARPTKSRTLYEQMLGRGTRPLTGIVDGIEVPENRIAAIRDSDKPFLLVLDFVGNSGKHKLVTSVDVLGGNYNDRVVEIANKNAEKKSQEGGGEPVDVITELQEAERQFKEEQRKQVEADERQRLRPNAKFTTAEIDPFQVLDITPWRNRGWDKDAPATKRQVAYIKNNGLDPDGLKKRHANQIITTIIKKRDSLPCSQKQAKQLKRFGYSTNATKAQASEIIDKIAANGWKRPA